MLSEDNVKGNVENDPHNSHGHAAGKFVEGCPLRHPFFKPFFTLSLPHKDALVYFSGSPHHRKQVLVEFRGMRILISIGKGMMRSM